MLLCYCVSCIKITNNKINGDVFEGREDDRIKQKLKKKVKI
jgi:hypothetical protein